MICHRNNGRIGDRRIASLSSTAWARPRLIPILLILLCRPVAAQERVGSVVGSVRTANHAIPAPSSVFLDRKGGTRTTTDDSGRFLLRSVSPGRHGIFVQGPQGHAVSSAFEVHAGQRTEIGVLDLEPGSGADVWLGCRVGIPRGAVCDTGHLLWAPRYLPGTGAGVVRDSATWATLWHVYKGEGPLYGRRDVATPHVNWDRQVVLLFTAFSPPATGHSPVNRVLEWPDSAVVELGPDSAGDRSGLQIDWEQGPRAVAVRRSDARFEFRDLADRGASFPLVDWRRLARLCPEHPSDPECRCPRDWPCRPRRR